MADVEVGQRWRSDDKREVLPWVTVLEVTAERIRIKRFQRTWVRRDLFLKHYTRIGADRG